MQIINSRESGAVINDECNLSAFSNKFVVELPDPFCEKVVIHPTLILRTIATCKFLTFLKHLGFADFPITNIGNFSPVKLAPAKPVKCTLLNFPPEHRSFLKCIDFDGSA